MSIIKPSNPAAVKLPNTGGFGGMGNQMGYQQQMQQPQASPSDMIRGLLSNSIHSQMERGSGSGLSWAEYESGHYGNQELLNKLRGETPEEDKTKYFLDQCSGYIKLYIDQLISRTGILYREATKSIENFRIDSNGFECPVRKAFIEDLTKRYEVFRILAINGSAYFGYFLVNVMKNRGNNNITETECFEGVNIAVRNVLSFEIIAWLNSSTRGKMYSHSLPDEIARSIANLDKFKEHSDAAFSMIGVPFPYSNLNFRPSVSTRPDLGYSSGIVTDFIVGGSALQSSYSEGEVNYHNTDNTIASLQEFVSKAANQHHQDSIYRNHNPVTPNETYHSTFSTTRTDYENLNPYNRDEFGFKDHFHFIGRSNLFYVEENDWHNLKAGLIPAEGEVDDYGWGEGCYRVVEVDLSNPNSTYRTKLIRDKNISEVDVLTNPETLLGPYMSPEEMEVALIEATKTKEDKEEFIEIDDRVARDEEIPFAYMDKTLTTSNTISLGNQVKALGVKLSPKNGNKSFMVGTKVKALEEYVFNDREDKSVIEGSLSFLMSEVDKSKHRPIQLFGLIRTVFESNSLSGETMTFIDRVLTKRFNNFLIERLGFPDKKEEVGYLRVSSIIRDHLELSTIAREHFTELNGYLTLSGEENPLYALFNIFTKEDEFIDPLLKDSVLGLRRDVYVVYHKGETGPISMNESILFKRSNFPTIMNGVESGVEALSLGKDIDFLDVLIKFDDAGPFWRYLPTPFDRNVKRLVPVRGTSVFELD